ncbi:MAG: SycD/LcrH family type III secretion system chaperone [Candidatus Protochlamydia sp.]|nr:SycD/LcrH family type III secretion system chaperone [Candidatus Protochlamydia sp.]
MEKDEINALLNKAQGTPQFKKLAAESLQKIEEGELLKDALGFTPEMMDAVYSNAYNMFQSGQYKRALPLFEYLHKLDPLDYNYPFSIAACYQYQKMYEDAAAYYIICGELDPLNPVPRFHLFSCFVNMNELPSAWVAIQETITLAEMDPQYNELKDRALLEYKGFKKELKKYYDKKFGKEGKEFPDLGEGKL